MATTDSPTSTTKVEKVDPTFFIPQATQDNYLQIARDAAKAADITPKQAMRKLADDFTARHDDDPVGGWDHLSEWAKTVDPDETTGPSGLALAQARAVESARRDPQQALIGDQAVVAEAVKAVEAADANAGPAAVDGLTPNTGPVVPKD
ncbi:hypothetical protein [Klenkia brasiliensis]|uniref:Uncharacterized protein n=1 Tax=Klenkia brasiliensis TaxID=333142 RepID=A0A1G7YGB1_9ACTN|nr:hypothetical protein [Klenkia brasiliensis]SDG95387.1 hypothetical protein SAMN05660324_3943 [Klenkia brasiliensis]